MGIDPKYCGQDMCAVTRIRTGDKQVKSRKDQDTKQDMELVPLRRLPDVIQQSEEDWVYCNRWRRCDGCRTRGMLFCNFDKDIYHNIQQYPVTTVVQMVPSVTMYDSKHMCKECNAHKCFYDGEIDAVYLLRQLAMNLACDTRETSLWIQGAMLRHHNDNNTVTNNNDITSVLMSVASYLLPINDVRLKNFRKEISEKENKRLREGLHIIVSGA